jgi:hypothetical protein
MLPAADGPMDFRLAGSPPTQAPLLGGSPSGRYNSYLEFAPGVYAVTLTKSGQPQAPLGLSQVQLAASNYFTVLARPSAGGPVLEAISDTNDPKATSATLTVRNYFPGLSVDVFAGPIKIANALPYAGSVSIGGLPLERLSLTIRTILKNNRPAESGAEADFKLSKRATLLIIADDYGRFRPRVTLDGTSR